jgi:putative transposase
MKYRKAFKFRVYLNTGQRESLSRQFGHSRFIYNKMLSFKSRGYEQFGKSITKNQTITFTRRLKGFDQYTWLKECDSQVLQQALIDLDRAFKNFFEKRADYPKFKRKHDRQSIRYPQRFKVQGGHIYLPKVGWVRMVQHRPVEGKMKNCTVSKTKTGKYFVSIQCEIETGGPEPRTDEPQVGVDLGLKDFVVTSDGEKVKPPKYLRSSERRLKIRQRRLNRKKGGSSNRNKARHKVATTHEKVANQRKDFHHKLSRDLVDRYGHIAFENLNVAGMLKNHSLAKSIADAGWSQFVQFCEYKQDWAGGTTDKIDRWFPSSKACSACGSINHSLQLSDREWTCLDCGTLHDRDENAATNILNKSTVGATESYALGVTTDVGRSVQEAQVL